MNDTPRWDCAITYDDTRRTLRYWLSHTAMQGDNLKRQLVEASAHADEYGEGSEILRFGILFNICDWIGIVTGQLLGGL